MSPQYEGVTLDDPRWEPYFAQPRPHFYGQLRWLVDAGFIKRLMWGSDQMVWPRAINVAIEALESVPFLSAER